MCHFTAKIPKVSNLFVNYYEDSSKIWIDPFDRTLGLVSIMVCLSMNFTLTRCAINFHIKIYYFKLMYDFVQIAFGHGLVNNGVGHSHCIGQVLFLIWNPD